MEIAPLALTPVQAVGTPGIQGIASLMPKAEAQVEAGAPAMKFQNFLANSIDQTNQTVLEADDAVAKLVSGQDIDLHTVMISMEKADLSLQLAMQIRSKILDAYQQVMQMQI